MTDELTLIVNQASYRGWLSVEIERSLDQFAHRFSLRYLDREDQPWSVIPGAECSIRWGQEIMITGHVNRSRAAASESEWVLSCEGRSLTGDLVDCSSVHKTGAWTNKTAAQIIKDLCDPYGITVTLDVTDTEVFGRFAIEEGETVHETIDRLCKVRAFLPVTQPDGNILLTRIGQGALYTLDVAQAVAFEILPDDSGRHSEYLLRAVGIGSEADALVKASAIDDTVMRFRPLVVIGDAPSGSTAAKNRAQWEANVRAGRSERLRYTMLGAVNAANVTYQPGDLYAIQDDELGVDEIMVCERAVLRNSNSELLTELEFTRPEAYSQLTYPKVNLTARTKRGKVITKKTHRGGL
jgi:prophage tail gpP-like protein